MKLISFSEKRLALALSDYLRALGIPNHLEREQEGTAVVLDNPEDVSRARGEVEDFLSAPDHPRYWQASWQSGLPQAEPVYSGTGLSATAGWWRRAGMLTRAVTLLCLMVFAGLYLAPAAVFAVLHFPETVGMSGVGSQWWRLLTPAIMHFSVMHIAFNLLWWWELGGLIERGQSALRLLGITLVIALVSNAAQGLQYGLKFGGLSGVIYGLLGYLWIYPLCNPAAGFRLRKEILWFMIGWLVIGYTGVLDPFFGPVSNVGHLSGLLAGMVLGALIGLVNRGQVSGGGLEQK